MSSLKLPKIDKTMPIVVTKVKVLGMTIPVEFEGIITPQMQRFWQSAVIKTDDGSVIAGDKVSQVNISYTNPTISNPPTQAQVQYLSDKLGEVILALRP